MSCATLARQRIVMPYHRGSSCRTRIRRAERRRFPRYDVGLLVLLPGGIGRTVNLSETGVLIETDQMFCLMEPIELDLVLEEIDPERPYWMRCQGSIVRVEPATTGWRVAIDIDRYTLPSPRD
jgi:PilZ domain